IPLAKLILKVVGEKKFPQKRQARIKFVAESLAARGRVSARRSRDICEGGRARDKNATRILRYEFIVFCSCGYEGPSWEHSCPKCGAAIPFGLHQLFDSIG